MSAIASFGPGNTPLAVNHQSQFVASTISFNLPPGKSLSRRDRGDRRRRWRSIGVPATIHGSFQGTAQAFQQSLTDQPLLILAALLAVYIVLGMLYESYIHPITILSTLPSAGVGALLALLLFKTEFSIIALIGVILLIGIVKKNAIMMVDFAIDAARHGAGLSSRDAISRGVPAALPADHDDDRSRRCSARCRSRSASAKARSCARRSASRSSAG